MLKCYALVLALMSILLNTCCNLSFAKEVFIPMDSSQWRFKGEQFHCKLEQDIAHLGHLEFIAESGNPVRLAISSFYLLPSVTSIQVFSLLSPYQDDPGRTLIAETSQVNHHQAYFYSSVGELLAFMSDGAWLELKITSPQSPLSVLIPSVNLDPVMAGFNRCRAALPTLSYKQARDTELHYSLGQRTVSTKQKTLLKHLAAYMRLDKKITHILIDGHTDNVGSLLGNRQISRIRADDVANILEESGVRSKLIEVRAHGARYPIASNHTKEGRDLNRRVTIRVIRAKG